MAKLSTSFNFPWNFKKSNFSCTGFCSFFRLPLSVVCSISAIYDTTWAYSSGKKYRFYKRPCTFRANRQNATEKYHHHVDQSIAKLPSTWYYSTSIALYESCNWLARRREAMKFAPAKQFHWIWWPNRPPASVSHEIFKNPSFHARWFGQCSGFPCQSRAPFHRSMTPPEHIRVAKNTGSANDFAHFEQIDKMQPKNIITMSTNRSKNYPRHGITLQA